MASLPPTGQEIGATASTYNKVTGCNIVNLNAEKMWQAETDGLQCIWHDVDVLLFSPEVTHWIVAVYCIMLQVTLQVQVLLLLPRQPADNVHKTNAHFPQTQVTLFKSSIRLVEFLLSSGFFFSAKWTKQPGQVSRHFVSLSLSCG